MKKFISYIPWYHSTLFLMDKESHYHFGPCEAMLDLWYDVEIVTANKEIKIEEDPNYNPKIKIKYFDSVLDSLKYLWTQRSFSVIYANTFTVASLLVWLVGKKTIFFSHDPVFPTKYSPSYFLKNLLVRFTYLFFTKIRTINEYEVKRLKKSWFGSKWVCIPLVVSSKNYIPNIRHNNNILLLWHVFWKKDPETILHALRIVIKKYPDVHVYQVGDYSQYLSAKNKTYKELVSQFALDNNFTLLWRRKESLIELNLPTTIYLNSSLMEWQCISVYDAALLGNALCLPIMSSFLDVLDSKVKYHPLGDYKKLAANIIEYIENPKLKEEYIISNQQWILKKHNYEYIQKRIQQEFNLLSK